MATYRYLFADILTDRVIAELPMYGVSLTQQLNKAGNGTATIRLGDTENFSTQDILDATMPGRTAMYVDRDGAIIWGGIVWTRTYGSDGKYLQLSLQTFESYAYKRILRTDKVYTGVDQRNILRDLFTTMQGVANGNINIIVPSAYSTDVPRTLGYFGYEFNVYGDIVDYLIGYNLGFDYIIDVYYDSNLDIKKQLRCGQPYLGQPASSPNLQVFEYPGTITQYFWSESANGENQEWSTGAGEGAQILFQGVQDAASLAGGYPLIEDQHAYKDVSTLTTLTGHAVGNLAKYRVPINTPTVTVRADTEPVFGSYSMGDYGRFRITDDRFPSGFDTYQRIIGWTITPPSGDSDESISLELQVVDAV